MRIEAIDPIRDVDDNGTHVHMEPRDRQTVGDRFGRLACELGWAKDLDGAIATGERRTGPVQVTAEKTIVKPDVSA